MTDVLDHPRHFAKRTCRGSIALGSACGHCERCDEERRRLAPLPRPLPPDPRVAPAPFLTCGLTADELLRRAVANARLPVACWRWVAVMRLFALGSTAAQELCRRCGVDPDEEVKR